MRIDLQFRPVIYIGDKYVLTSFWRRYQLNSTSQFKCQLIKYKLNIKCMVPSMNRGSVFDTVAVSKKSSLEGAALNVMWQHHHRNRNRLVSPDAVVNNSLFGRKLFYLPRPHGNSDRFTMERRKMVKKILMVCLGNICRSPIAEAVMHETIRKNGLAGNWEVDSAAIGEWHRGNPPDHRALNTMAKHGLSYSNRARQIKDDDFEEFDYIFGMDEENMNDLHNLAPPGTRAKLLLLGDFGLDPQSRIIEDPYYQRGEAGFEKAFQQCAIACEAFLQAAVANKI